MKKFEYAYCIKDGYLYKEAKASKHFLREPPAICFDYVLYNKYRAKIKGVMVFEKESKKVYYVSNDVISHFGFIIERGYGKQKVVPLNLWKIQGEEMKTLFGGENEAI